tara:strand:+ start:173 stop:547 length:375 start_codon:yes stop_codon:yes gene_type:complete
MAILLSIFLGGGFGALLRFLISEQINRLFLNSFPFGTIVVNVLGAFLIGLAVSYFSGKVNFSQNMKMFLIIGFLGGFTTFSTFNLDFYQLFSNGEIVASLLYLFATFILTVIAFYLGLSLVKFF